MRIAFVLIGIACLLSVGRPAEGQSLEPWADAALPVKQNVVLWLDASRIGAARKALGRGELPSSAPLGTWFDASGRRLDLRQDDLDAAPQWIAVGRDALVRFDGENDVLRLTQTGGELKEFRFFVVVSPRRNDGFFRGIVAFNAPGQRDYTSGLNLDLGATSSARLSVLNVEGRGFSGSRDLFDIEEPFGKLHLIEVVGDAKEIAIWVDGKPHGKRPRTGDSISMEEITLGARFYNNDGPNQKAQGFGAVDIAEFLVYGAALSDGDAKQVRDYLNKKHSALAANLPPDTTAATLKRRTPMSNPPPVQVLLPGFEVHELPLDLTNINNLRCRPDGTIVAVAYNGNIWLLRDKDGDGLEETAELFWENKGQLVAPIGAALTPPGYRLGFGVFVAAKGKVSLLLDRDGDDKADEEIIVASGWTPLPVNVDAIGLAIDPKDQSIYFGLGTPDFANAYQIGPDGAAKFRLDNPHGTIQRISPDFKTRETICTGVRFTVGMAFNKAGDLFVSDQEGATWLPNGNPFDELLHIQTGRHYGFPPRHPKHLPNVIDEPSVYDFGPQHQSTCGLIFNEPVLPDGKHFGPEAWRGDAITAGESRGKLYRTKLTKTDAGYIAQTQLFACLSMLTVDPCVTREGDLLVACHSGGPDWGSGPAGKGKIFKIRYVDREHPQPVFAWPASPSEVRVEFDRPVSAELLREVAAKGKLLAGAYVRAGDRFETIWPGYAVVEAQKDSPWRELAIHSAQLTPDGRTLVLATDRHSTPVHYALTIPGMGRPPRGKEEGTLRPQEPEIDLDYNLTGCEAEWTTADGQTIWKGWLPHLDLATAKAFTEGSAPHNALWKAMSGSGSLTLRFQLQLDDLLRPAVQPGSTIDYVWPPEEARILFQSDSPITLELSGKRLSGKNVSLTLAPQDEKVLRGELRLVCNGESPSLNVTFSTQEDSRPRALPLRRIYLPWVDLKSTDAAAAPTFVRAKELEGGSWARGRRLFHSEAAKCSKCHSISGQGGAIGPDLTNLIHRDYASVFRDVTQPSFAINPDYASSVFTLDDGRVITGSARTIDGKLHIGDTDGKVTVVDPKDVESSEPSKLSIMPENLLKDLSEADRRDLFTYLLTPPPTMPRDLAEGRPRPRPRGEVLALLAGAPERPAKLRRVNIVLVAGPKDHGPGEHDYPAWQKAWTELIASAEEVDVSTAWEWPSKEQFAKADVLVFFQRGTWNPDRAADLDPFLARGGGALFIHWAVEGNPNAEEFAQRIGLACKQIKYRHGPLDVEFNRAISHPVARNFTRLQMVDESYWEMTGQLADDRVIATSREDGASQPIFWSLEHGKGRVFVSIPGHYSWSFDDPAFRILLLRGIAWCAKEPVDRFNDLVWPGAEFAR